MLHSNSDGSTPFDDGNVIVPTAAAGAAAEMAAAVMDLSPFDDVPATAAVTMQSMPAAHAPASRLAPPVLQQQASPFDEPAPGAPADSGNPFDEEDEEPLVRAHNPGQPLGRANPSSSAASASAAAAGGSFSSSSALVSASTTGDDTLLPDEIDFSELQFDERIGIGAYAEVYSGQWRGCDVAIKRMHASHFSSPEAVTEFRAEMQLLRTLRHPNCLLFMAACTRAPNLCVITELLATSLFDLLHNSDVALSWRATLQIALDTAKGMSYLHLNKGGAILHRDLKSPNILLDSGRRAKVRLSYLHSRPFFGGQF
jgi:hypothetical protein